jgi:AbrB family looped-hinge helix DNA binding protein
MEFAMSETNVKERLTADLPTKSAKIRALHGAGYSRTEIADFLNIRYQHVRNVLVNDARVAGTQNVAAHTAGLLGGDSLQPMNIRMGPDGRIMIPAEFREALGLKDGDTLLASLDDGELRLLTIPTAVRKAQSIIRQFVPEGVSLVDELIADRRREAEREQQNG